MPYSYAVQGMPYTLCMYALMHGSTPCLVLKVPTRCVDFVREPSRSVMLQQNDKLSNAPEDGCVQKGGNVSVCAAARHRD